MPTPYATRLHAAVRRKGNPIVVGLDPRFDSLPPDVVAAARERHDDPVAAAAFEEFCVRLIDVVAPLVPAVKPQAAFFEEYGPDGCLVLSRVIRYARHAGLIVICDAKRGDIGSTAEAYARAWAAFATATALRRHPTNTAAEAAAARSVRVAPFDDGSTHRSPAGAAMNDAGDSEYPLPRRPASSARCARTNSTAESSL